MWCERPCPPTSRRHSRGWRPSGANSARRRSPNRCRCWRGGWRALPRTASRCRLAEHYAVSERLSEGKAALLGGAITGALAGLKADIATGGLTLGGGLLVGGVLGALGAAGLARGYNVIRGTEQTEIGWTDEVLDGLTASALLAYLAVAHFGRGRGEWTESEHPAHWQEAVRAVLQERRPAFAELWARRGGARSGEEELAAALQAELTQATRTLLGRLYPQPAATEPATAPG
jgi:hypothetical protein